MQTKNSTLKSLLLKSDLPQNLKEQLLNECQAAEKKAAIAELELKNKAEEIIALNQIIETLKKDSNISWENIQELDSKFRKKKLQDSHELKTLVDVILRMSCFLKNSNLDDNQKKYVNTIQRSTGDILTNLNFGHSNTKEIEVFDNVNISSNKQIAQSVTNIQKEDAFPDHWKTFKFLMIEDNRADIILFKCIFKLWGLHLDVVTSLSEAKEKLKEKYDCILSDVVLPDGNGLGHIYELRIDEKAVNKNTPVIILTANASKSGAKMAQEANVQYYFSKPFSLKLLRDGLQQIFNTKEFSKKSSIKVVLDSRNTWTWYEVLSFHLNGRDHFIKEFMGIFLIQAKNINALFSHPIKVENVDALQYEMYKFKSTVHTIGLRDTYNYLTKISQEVKIGVNTENLNKLISDFRSQLKQDIENVESKVEEHTNELSVSA